MSIPSNIAEGCGRGGDKELARFLQIAMGSASEAEYRLMLSHELNYLTNDEYIEFEQAIVEVKRMLTAFLKTVKSK